MPSKRDRRRSILSDDPDQPVAPPPFKLISFGSPRQPADRCTYRDTPAEFSTCLECRYNNGAQGSGIRCTHRFGLDPTIVGGITTQFNNGDILPIDE